MVDIPKKKKGRKPKENKTKEKKKTNKKIKGPPKKRGRKPKGGKILQIKPAAATNTIVKRPNIILVSFDSLTSRDMVIRLAHQGWKVEQIMQATKLSRGEVELILELSSKK